MALLAVAAELPVAGVEPLAVEAVLAPEPAVPEEEVVVLAPEAAADLAAAAPELVDAVASRLRAEVPPSAMAPAAVPAPPAETAPVEMEVAAVAAPSI